MPSFARELEETLNRALGEAAKRSHEYATLEHLLIGLIDDAHASRVMNACGVNRDELRTDVKSYLDTQLNELRINVLKAKKRKSQKDKERIAAFEKDGTPTPTSGFQRVVQRSILH